MIRVVKWKNGFPWRIHGMGLVYFYLYIYDIHINHSCRVNMGVSENRGGPPKWMVKTMEHPFWNGWFGGENPLFSETSIYHPLDPSWVLLKVVEVGQVFHLAGPILADRRPCRSVQRKVANQTENQNWRTSEPPPTKWYQMLICWVIYRWNLAIHAYSMLFLAHH